MKNLKTLGKALTIVFILAGMFACNDDDNSVPFNVIGDVFVVKRMVGDEVKYANSYAAWGNQPMSFAQVTTPLGAEIDLSPANASQNTWIKDPSENDYTTNLPVENNYQFLVINEDITHQAVDLLDFDNIDFTTITAAGVVMELLTVEWETNTFAEAYMIRLINASGDLAFLSQPLPVQMRKLEIGISTASGSWLETPAVNDVYTLELLAFRFEDDATGNDADYHIQEIAVTEQEITWQ